MTQFIVPVSDAKEGKLILDTLARYDLFQLEHNVKPDFANAGGLSIYEDGEWCDWYSEWGYSIDQVSFKPDGGIVEP